MKQGERVLAGLALSAMVCAGAVAQPESTPKPQPEKPSSLPAPSGQPAPAGEGAKEPPKTAPGTPPTVGPQGTRPQYKLDDQGQFVVDSMPEAGSDEAVIMKARRLLAEDRPGQAKELLDAWLERNERGGSPVLPQAFLLRGDATSADGDEFEALYDYEQVIQAYPGSPEFVVAVEREVEIATRYLRGLERKWLGMRIVSADDVGVELMIRAQERMPGSRLGERASIELADFFYRERELGTASEAYELFEKNYPNSQYRPAALERRIYASVGRFKGARYDTGALTDAAVLTRRFMNMYPARAQEIGLDSALLSRIDESAAAAMYESAMWYVERGDPAGASYTLKRLVRRHPQSAAAERALKLLIDKGWLKPGESLEPAKPKQPVTDITKPAETKPAESKPGAGAPAPKEPKP